MAASHIDAFASILAEAQRSVCTWSFEELDRAHKWACGVEQSVRRLSKQERAALEQQLLLKQRKSSKQPALENSNELARFCNARRTFLETVLNSPFFFQKPLLLNWLLSVYKTEAAAGTDEATMIMEVCLCLVRCAHSLN
jgi:hypothetical protein